MVNHSFLTTKSHNTLFFNVKKSLTVLFGVFLLSNCDNPKQDSPNNSDDLKGTVVSMMQEQEDSWNEGDIEEFMKHYWKSDSLRFIGKSGLNQGWQKTLDNYKKSYKSKEEMGTLKFNNKSIEILGEESIFVIGEWHLMRQDSLGDLQGMYSLIWQQKNGKWVITTDHSS
jgi:hypothetical protein